MVVVSQLGFLAHQWSVSGPRVENVSISPSYKCNMVCYVPLLHPSPLNWYQSDIAVIVSPVSWHSHDLCSWMISLDITIVCVSITHTKSTHFLRVYPSFHFETKSVVLLPQNRGRRTAILVQTYFLRFHFSVKICELLLVVGENGCPITLIFGWFWVRSPHFFFSGGLWRSVAPWHLESGVHRHRRGITRLKYSWARTNGGTNGLPKTPVVGLLYVVGLLLYVVVGCCMLLGCCCMLL